MKRALFCTLVLSLSLLAYPASAGTVQGKVVLLQAGHGYTPDDAYVLVKFDTDVTGGPACATDATRLALNPATEAGKAMLSMLLAAQAAGLTVEAFGRNNCDVMGSVQESLSYIRIE